MLRRHFLSLCGAATTLIVSAKDRLVISNSPPRPPMLLARIRKNQRLHWFVRTPYYWSSGHALWSSGQLIDVDIAASDDDAVRVWKEELAAPRKHIRGIA